MLSAAEHVSTQVVSVQERGRVNAVLRQEDRVRLFQYNEELGRETFKILDKPEGTLIEVGPLIGLFALPSFTLRVLPKTDVHPFNVLYMLWRVTGKRWPLPPVAHSFDHSELQDVLAAIFLRELEEQVRRGLLRQQEVVREDALAVRGRVRVPEYLRRTDPTRIPVEYTDLTANHPVNRLFGLVLERLSRQVISAPLRQQVTQLRVLFHDAQIQALRAVPVDRKSYRLNRLYQRYEPALSLAWLLLDGVGHVPEQGKWASPAFAFNMDVLFERFLERVITEDLLVGRPYKAGAQGSGLYEKYLFSRETQELKPDLVITEAGQVRLIVDFKNKRPKSQFGREDLYQMYAYARHLDCDRVLLLYPGRTVPSAICATRGAPLTVATGSVDLSVSWFDNETHLCMQLREHLRGQGLNL